jgi:hypothetical protein
VEKVRALGDEARAALRLIPEHNRALLLTRLADAQLGAGDQEGARRTLEELEPLLTGPGTDFQRAQTSALWARAGDTAHAKLLLGTLSGQSQIMALRLEGLAQVQAGYAAEAVATLDAIDKAAPVAPAASIQANGVAQFHDVAIAAIGSAFADARDFADAEKAVAHLSPGLQQATLLADIASKQCTVGVSSAREGLTAARAAASAVAGSQANFAARAVAYADATCGDVPGAVTAAHQLAGDKAGDTLVTIADQLSQHGDYAHSRQIDDANGAAITSAEDLLGLAKRQIVRGDRDIAAATLATAAQKVRADVAAATQRSAPLYQVLDAQKPAGGIIEAYVQLGAFKEAIDLSTIYDHLNRPQFLVRVAVAEGDQHDTNALHRDLPAIVAIIEQGQLAGPSQQLAQIALGLAHAGDQADANDLLDRARHANSGLDRVLSSGAAWIAPVQVAVGDIDGARATLRPLLPGAFESPNSATIIPQELINEGRFNEAQAFLGDLDQDQRGMLLGSIAVGEMKAGHLNEAMTLAWQITDPRQRAGTMQGLLKEVARGT